LPSCDVLGYGRRDVDIALALSRDGSIHHFNIVLSLLLIFIIFIVFVYVLQVGIGERRPNQRY
jgi:hypothetical protein